MNEAVTVYDPTELKQEQLRSMLQGKVDSSALAKPEVQIVLQQALGYLAALQLT